MVWMPVGVRFPYQHMRISKIAEYSKNLGTSFIF